MLATATVSVACAGPAPDVPVGPDGTADPVLVEGRAIWASQCSKCHGSSGGGDQGPGLNNGRVIEVYPDPADQIMVVVEGRGQVEP